MRRTIPVWPLLACLVFGSQGCVKRISVSVGGERSLKAGEPVSLGQPLEVPPGGRVSWSLGDGVTAEGPQVTHTWQAPGRYPVEVVVTDPDGQQRRDTAQLEVVRPPLLEVLPAEARALFLVDRPGTGLVQLPLLLERLLATGQDANAALAGVREVLGMDPFSEEGWRAAGLDPAGGVAGVALRVGERDAGLLVLALLPGDKARETVLAAFSRQQESKVQPLVEEPRIEEVRAVVDGALLGAWAVHRGHLWVAMAGDSGVDPTALVRGVIEAPVAPGLGEAPEYREVLGPRPQPGALHLYLSEAFVRQAASDAEGDNAETARSFAERLRHLRLDLDFEGTQLLAELRLGLRGEEASRLAKVLRARNAVPALRRLPFDQPHLVLKLSADTWGLVREVLQLAGETAQLGELDGALEQAHQATGIDVRAAVLDNLGDSYLLQIALRLPALLGLAGGAAGGERGWRDFLDAVLWLQLREPAALRQALERLADSDAGGLVQRLPAVGTGARFRLGPPEQAPPLVLALDGASAVVASSEALAERALASAAQAAGTPAAAEEPAWPAALEQPQVQLLAVDLGRLTGDLAAAEVASQDSAAALAKALVGAFVARIGPLGLAWASGVLESDRLTLRVRLGLR